MEIIQPARQRLNNHGSCLRILDGWVGFVLGVHDHPIRVLVHLEYPGCYPFVYKHDEHLRIVILAFRAFPHVGDGALEGRDFCHSELIPGLCVAEPLPVDDNCIWPFFLVFQIVSFGPFGENSL